MIYVKFREKHEDRIVSGDDIETIMYHILKERIEDTYDDGSSIWYDEETEKAKQALEEGRTSAYRFMANRRRYEYEDWDQIGVEYVQ